MLKIKAKSALKKFIQKVRRSNQEVDALYKVLYDQVHRLDQSLEITPKCTLEAFSQQWTNYPKGEYLLSDPWFRENVDTILSQQEILLKKEWFKGKKILDAGCGNGRWAYGFSKLGADVTCVDANLSALKATESELAGFSNQRRFIHTPLEELDQHVAPGSFDLAFSWGVLHHCPSFSKSLKNVAATVKEGGVLYLYLYGRESYSMDQDIELFKKRVVYNTLLDHQQRYQFLLDEARGDENKVHNVHDVYAPLINRRLEYDQIEKMLRELGFSQIFRTIDYTELFIRAIKGSADYSAYTLQPKKPPYWFQGKHLD